MVGPALGERHKGDSSRVLLLAAFTTAANRSTYEEFTEWLGDAVGLAWASARSVDGFPAARKILGFSFARSILTGGRRQWRPPGRNGAPGRAVGTLGPASNGAKYGAGTLLSSESWTDQI